MNFFNDHKTIIILIGGLLLIVIYSMIAVFINKLNNAINGKTTLFAWVPVTNGYLIGKLVFNKVVGVLLSILFLFGIFISVDIPGLENIKKLIPNEMVIPYITIYVVVIIIFLLIGKSKLEKIIREGTGNDEMSKFIAKDYSEKEPVITETVKPKEIQEGIKDEYQYNHTSLSEVSHLNDNSNKNNP